MLMAKMGAWKKAPQELVELFTEALKSVPEAQPRKLFGYPAAFVNGQMFTGLFADYMFLRLDEAGREEIGRLGGGPFEPMPGRPMREYAVVAPAVLRSKPKLAAWLARSFEYASSLGPKKGASKKPVARKPARRR
jgi:TfoX/Sxy family transcriptional regulator of competence genes